MSGDQFDFSIHARLVQLSDEISEISVLIEANTLMLDTHPELIKENRLLLRRCANALRELEELRSGVRRPDADDSPSGRSSGSPVKA